MRSRIQTTEYMRRSELIELCYARALKIKRLEKYVIQLENEIKELRAVVKNNLITEKTQEKK